LEYLQLLIFEELEEFTVNRIPKRGGPMLVHWFAIWFNNIFNVSLFRTYRSYQTLEQDYVVGAVDANELKAALYQVVSAMY